MILVKASRMTSSNGMTYMTLGSAKQDRMGANLAWASMMRGRLSVRSLTP
jgi:hypothetical protein